MTVPEMSPEQALMRMTRDERAELLDGMTPEQVEGLIWDWQFRARPSQFIDPNDLAWRVLVLGAGRGSGKSLSGSQWLRGIDADPSSQAARLAGMPGPLRFSLVGRTAADVRDVMLNGESGLLNVYPPSERDQVNWTPTRREVILPNGAVGLCFSAEEPDQLRGPQSHVTWADELSSFSAKRSVDGLTTWDNCRIGTRLGPVPQTLVTTTPKRTPEVRKLWAEANDPQSHTLLRRMATGDNPFLADAYLDVLYGLFQGTTIGEQELEGVLLDDIEGALLTVATLDAYRIPTDTVLPALQIVVGVDPSVSTSPRDECGIVVVAATKHPDPLSRHAYVLEDVSLRASPGVWSKAVVAIAQKHSATVVAETNQGGDLVRRTLHEAARALDTPPPRVVVVNATRSKTSRAEPVVAAYERGRVHHVGNHADLEDQLTTWTPGSGYSPDRLDALVHGLTALILPSTVKQGLGSAVVDTRVSRLHLDFKAPAAPTSNDPRYAQLPREVRGR